MPWCFICGLIGWLSLGGVRCRVSFMLQVTEPLLEQLTGDDLSGILEYYKEDFNIGGYTYTQG